MWRPYSYTSIAAGERNGTCLYFSLSAELMSRSACSGSVLPIMRLPHSMSCPVSLSGTSSKRASTRIGKSALTSSTKSNDPLAMAASSVFAVMPRRKVSYLATACGVNCPWSMRLSAR